MRCGVLLVTPEALEAAQQARQDMSEALKAKRAALNELLRKKVEELKGLCVKEMSITGTLPAEWPPEHPKPVKTEYSISQEVINRPSFVRIFTTDFGGTLLSTYSTYSS